MKIAVTYENGQVFQHFGHCENFKIYDVNDGMITDSQVVSAAGSGHGALAGFLKDRGVDTLICGGIGIEFYPGVTGDADQNVTALLAGKLYFNPDTMCSHHHEEGHNCGNHSCGEEKHGCAGNQ